MKHATTMEVIVSVHPDVKALGSAMESATAYVLMKLATRMEVIENVLLDVKNLGQTMESVMRYV